MNFTTYEWLCLIGLPSLISTLMSILIKVVWEKGKSQKNQTDTLKLGVQALLRSQMIADYNKWSDKGYAPIYARENFENCHKQYTSLGANGVMEDIYKRFMALPTKEGDKDDG